MTVRPRTHRRRACVGPLASTQQAKGRGRPHASGAATGGSARRSVPGHGRPGAACRRKRGAGPGRVEQRPASSTGVVTLPRHPTRARGRMAARGVTCGRSHCAHTGPAGTSCCPSASSTVPPASPCQSMHRGRPRWFRPASRRAAEQPFRPGEPVRFRLRCGPRGPPSCPTTDASHRRGRRRDGHAATALGTADRVPLTARSHTATRGGRLRTRPGRHGSWTQRGLPAMEQTQQLHHREAFTRRPRP